MVQRTTFRCLIGVLTVDGFFSLTLATNAFWGDRFHSSDLGLYVLVNAVGWIIKALVLILAMVFLVRPLGRGEGAKADALYRTPFLFSVIHSLVYGGMMLLMVFAWVYVAPERLGLSVRDFVRAESLRSLCASAGVIPVIFPLLVLLMKDDVKALPRLPGPTKGRYGLRLKFIVTTLMLTIAPAGWMATMWFLAETRNSVQKADLSAEKAALETALSLASRRASPVAARRPLDFGLGGDRAVFFIDGSEARIEGSAALAIYPDLPQRVLALANLHELDGWHFTDIHKGASIALQPVGGGLVGAVARHLPVAGIDFWFWVINLLIVLLAWAPLAGWLLAELLRVQIKWMPEGLAAGSIPVLQRDELGESMAALGESRLCQQEGKGDVR